MRDKTVLYSEYFTMVINGCLTVLRFKIKSFILMCCVLQGEKICFIMDESNVLDSSFLERMNTLLANGEVPGLFEGDELTTLMTQCKEGAQREGSMLDSQEELYKWFTQQVMRNLHVVFTMNPSSEGLKDRAATSPALFNRCAFFAVMSRLYAVYPTPLCI